MKMIRMLFGTDRPVWHRRCLSQSGERSQPKEPSDEVGYDSHPGSTYFRDFPADRSFLQPEEGSDATSSYGGEARGGSAARAESGGRIQGSRESALPSRPHLGAE